MPLLELEHHSAQAPSSMPQRVSHLGSVVRLCVLMLLCIGVRLRRKVRKIMVLVQRTKMEWAHLPVEDTHHSQVTTVCGREQLETTLLSPPAASTSATNKLATAATTTTALVPSHSHNIALSCHLPLMSSPSCHHALVPSRSRAITPSCQHAPVPSRPRTTATSPPLLRRVPPRLASLTSPSQLPRWRSVDKQCRRLGTSLSTSLPALHPLHHPPGITMGRPRS